ncbi:cAMP phosphodiesterases class-II-domain-containing protein [Multifurca ochricompacta]|uniref:cAMP phosphodiesterases class-II-domain-containing protein n=1 Tax=Multifurca ochricompacta TaxID=376703 RepID=A0AAD4MAE1_9AGAM|nr:cAMP phosphodiesterases class-II-domain-containing protein [Multifurca ochricompacta]
MPTFDLVVVGSGGGPHETNLSSYLFKPCDTEWKDGIIALEAGSGIGTLHQLLTRDETLFNDLSSYQVYSLIHCFLISHAHLDHVNGLILSAGALHGHRKRVCASLHALKSLETIFADRIWPNLASWDANDAVYKLLYDPLKFDDENYRTIFRDVSVRAMPVLHGKNDTLGDYESSAFFIRYDPSGKEFLFFGDVSPDSLTSQPQTIAVWRAAARKIPNTLSTIFIECSWPVGRPDELLYGISAPSTSWTSLPHSRLRRLERKYSKPIYHVIRDQVKALVQKKGLGAEVLSAEQGMTIMEITLLRRTSLAI